ncbi:MAG: hypothetical protein JNK63_08590 [Chthonomonas sp.]|nr:hypothetical protein [Chthonomonas sp.]
MNQSDLLQTLLAGFLGAALAFGIQWRLTLRKEATDREAAKKKLRAERCIARQTHLGRLIAYLLEFEAVAQRTRDVGNEHSLMNSHDVVNMRSANPNKTMMFQLHSQSFWEAKALKSKMLAEAEQYGELPYGIKFEVRDLSRYVYAVVYGRIDNLLSVNSNPHDIADCWQHIQCLIQDLRSLMAAEQSLASDAIELPEKAKYLTPELPYLSRMAYAFKKRTLDPANLDYAFLQIPGASTVKR